jgi:hypothetical protein
MPVTLWAPKPLAERNFQAFEFIDVFPSRHSMPKPRDAEAYTDPEKKD